MEIYETLAVVLLGEYWEPQEQVADECACVCVCMCVHVYECAPTPRDVCWDEKNYGINEWYLLMVENEKEEKQNWARIYPLDHAVASPSSQKH